MLLCYFGARASWRRERRATLDCLHCEQTDDGTDSISQNAPKREWGTEEEEPDAIAHAHTLTFPENLLSPSFLLNSLPS